MEDSEHLDLKLKLETQHFDMMNKMRVAWTEKYDTMKQIHIEFKEDIEKLISKREQQIAEFDQGEFPISPFINVD